MLQSVKRNSALWMTVAVLVCIQGRAIARPWTTREPSHPPNPAHQLRSSSYWPAEPSVPDGIEPVKFQQAYAHLCNLATNAPRAALASKILEVATSTSTDPFSLAALAFFTSHCDPDFHHESSYGLIAIEPAMYRSSDAPPLPIDRSLLNGHSLLDPANNLAVAGALLSWWQDHHKEIDRWFGGVSHRTALSHMIWGDEVRSSGHEDLVLTARRRMIASYLGTPETPRKAPIGIEIVPPLEGAPRVASSGPGDDRDGGARQHRGLDLAATLGEPVRSIADGTVIFAGANIPGKSRKGPIPPDQIGRYRNRRLGVGGIYLCIQHQAEPKKIVSCYMHLQSYVVAEKQEVKMGETIGYVGRTGVRVSPPHLHLEVRVDDRFTNPVRTLGETCIPPQATLTHQYVLRAKRARRLHV